MLILNGEYIKTVLKRTKKGREYKVHQILVNGGDFSNIINVKDYTGIGYAYTGGENISIPVWCSAWSYKDRVGLDYLRSKEEVETVY
jgi:hypothetical protein